MISVACLFWISSFVLGNTWAQYNATWESLDSRPLPTWFDKAKVGIFVHWGAYSVVSYGDAWFWWDWQGNHDETYEEFMRKNYPPNFTYQDFAKDFTAEFFNPEEWADLFERSGAKYVVLTSKHHEGFAMWPSKYSYSWNSMDVGPKRDIVGAVSKAVRGRSMHFGLYYSLYEWFNPLWQDDQANDFRTSTFVDSKMIPEIKELVQEYKPELLWSDGDWDAPDSYWKSKELLQWLYNESPVRNVVVTNDRWGWDSWCAHGGYFSCVDRYNPGFLLSRKWENALPIDWWSWGYRRTAKLRDILSIHELLDQMASSVSCGGNILINVGPTKEGTIAPIFQERLLQLGEWLGINGEGIYETTPWRIQNDTVTSGVWYTFKDPVVYAIVLQWPSNNVLALGSIKSLLDAAPTTVTLLGNNNLELSVNRWVHSNGSDDHLIRSAANNVYITFPDKADVNSQWAWVLKFAPK